MPLEFEQIRGLFGKKNDIFAEHFSLDWHDVLETHPHNWLILGTRTELTCCAGQFCLWSVFMWWELDCLRRVRPSSVTFASTRGWTFLCFSCLHTAARYLGGISLRAEFSGPVHCWDSSPFLWSCWCWLWSVTALTNHLTAVQWGWGELRSLTTALIFQMCYFYTRADNLFVASDFNT